MKLRKLFSGILMVEALTLGTSVYAYDVSGLWGLSGNAQIAVPLGDSTVRSRGELGSDLGGMVRYGLSKEWGVGLSYEDIYMQHGFRAQPISLQGLYTFWPESRLTMTGLLGGGVASGSPHGTYNNASGKAGLGLDYFVLQNFSIGPHVTYHYISKSGDAPHEVHELGVGLLASLYFGEPRVPAAMAAVPVAVVAAPKKKPVVIVLQDTHFDFDKSTLKPEAKTMLDTSIQTLKSNPDTYVRLAGYTSAEGTEAYNQKLSERRADVVRNYLIAGGIAPDRMTVIGYGEAKPAEFESDPQKSNSTAAKANMRTLFEIVVK
jgi:outer membrane protein OmpA-like peptidoglycan-associated protein